MLTKLIDILGDATDVRTIAAYVGAALVTIFHPGNSSTVVAVVDAGAALIVAVDQALLHITTKASTPATAPPRPSPPTA